MRPPPDIHPLSGSQEPVGWPPPRDSSLSGMPNSSSATHVAQSRAWPKDKSPITRKPLPANGSPIAGRYSSGGFPWSGRFVTSPVSKRSISLDLKPGSSPNSPLADPPASAGRAQAEQVLRELDGRPRGFTNYSYFQSFRQSSPLSPRNLVSANTWSTPSHAVLSNATAKALRRPNNDRKDSSNYTVEQSLAESEEDDPDQFTVGDSRTPTMAAYHVHSGSNSIRAEIVQTPGDEVPPHLGGAVKRSSPSKSSKISSFFNWKQNRSPSLDSPTTTFSDQSMSPKASPMPPFSAHPQRTLLAPVDVSRANASAQHSHYVPDPLFMMPVPTAPQHSQQVAELEQELREISAELAQSVRREMELEDEVEKLRAEKTSSNLEADRRNSDYYSDSGTNSGRHAPSDSDGRIEELEMLQRKTEQGKAQMKIDMSRRLEDALRQKRIAEDRVYEVEQTTRSPAGIGGTDRVRELETSLEEAKRKMSDERQFRESYESLIAGMRLEMEQHRNERDNLRDEVVPQLQAKIEGLETDSSILQHLTYENSRMQQELDALKSLKRSNISATIDEEASSPISPTFPTLGRSKSLMTKRGTRSRSNTVLSRPTSIRDSALSRSNSQRRETMYESRDELCQRVKELQEQRDALHSTVKSLILRHFQMERDFAKRAKKMEWEAEKLANLTPKRSAFQNEVRNLREEVTGLRRRADDALTQKWQCEKGLSGLKMDLDRAQVETSSLRQLLQERDIFVPDNVPSQDGQRPASSLSLDKAYMELRATHDLSIASIRGLDTGAQSKFFELLKQSISDAEAERDQALSQASQYRDEARKLQKSEIEHLSKESALASDLYASAQRMDELAANVQSQIQSNSQLRNRLAEAIGRGEKEQQDSASRIGQLQGRLRDLEEQLVNAQQHSEEVIAAQEDEVRELQQAHSSQLQRTKAGGGTPKLPPTPLTPMFAGRSPRLDKTTSGYGMSLGEASRTGILETRVKELENALSTAEKEMHEVVARMNMAQIEVAELQGERDEAMMRTRKLQNEILLERQNVKSLMAANSFRYPDDY